MLRILRLCLVVCGLAVASPAAAIDPFFKAVACHSQEKLAEFIEPMLQQRQDLVDLRLRRLGHSMFAPCFYAALNQVEKFEVIKRYPKFDVKSRYQVEAVILWVQYKDKRSVYVLLDKVVGHDRPL